MGYEINEIAFYEISTNKMLIQNLPTPLNKEELKVFIQQYRNYDPNSKIKTNTNKCLHCVSCNLCDKTIADNVY
jgi:CRISPR-associated protein Cas4